MFSWRLIREPHPEMVLVMSLNINFGPRSAENSFLLKLHLLNLLDP